MTSERLEYYPVSLSTLDAFHQLVQDPHVRRYLMDGQVFGREWSEERVLGSLSLFDRRGVGLWLARDKKTAELVGFCGFLEFPSMHHEPQLVYALFQRYTGEGYATEMARTSVAEARRHPGFSTIVASVDEINAASVRVLHKLGFRQISAQTGSFGKLLVMLLSEGGACAEIVPIERPLEGAE